MHIHALHRTGIATMLRIHPPDILHTVLHGSLEYGLGFTLQIIKLIANIDKSEFGRSTKLLEDAVRLFPAFNAFQPVRPIHFENVWELCPSSNSKSKGKDTNSTNGIAMKEYFKIPPATFQVMICCSNSKILPNTNEWSKKMGFEQPFFNPLQVVVNSLFSLMKVYWYLHAPSLTETQIVTLKLLVANAQGHLLLLDVIRKRLIEFNKPTPRKPKSKLKKSDIDEGHCLSGNASNSRRNGRSSSSSCDNVGDDHNEQMLDAIDTDFVLKDKVSLENVSLLINPKLELLSHLPQCKRDTGCDNSVKNTELGELFMKLVRCIWNTTSKKFASVEYEMLKKYRNLQVLDLIKRGINHRNGRDIFSQKRVHASKAFMGDIFVAENDIFAFAVNCTNKPQEIQWSHSKKSFLSSNGTCLNVHNILLDVSYYIK